jgi:hypothetical protein
MKNFTKISIFSLLVAVLFSACNKTTVTTRSTGNTGNYSMAFAYNNTSVSFNTCFATQSTVNNSSQFLILGYNTTGNKVSNNSFEVDLYANIDSIKVGQVFPASTTFLQHGTMALYFSPDTVNTYVTQTAKPVGSVTITAITATEIKGTFSGDLFGEFDSNGSNLLYTISSGSFTAKLE